MTVDNFLIWRHRVNKSFKKPLKKHFHEGNTEKLSTFPLTDAGCGVQGQGCPQRRNVRGVKILAGFLKHANGSRDSYSKYVFTYGGVSELLPHV